MRLDIDAGDPQHPPATVVQHTVTGTLDYRQRPIRPLETEKAEKRKRDKRKRDMQTYFDFFYSIFKVSPMRQSRQRQFDP
ncbi:MAG: hypothetical protein EA402_00875, partial [Planctomycetota bacterium]